MSEVLERRLDFLKLEALGFSLCEIVKQLSEKYQTSPRNIYYDAENRGTWQPVLTQLFDLDKARLVVTNRYEYLYRLASLIFKQQVRLRSRFIWLGWWRLRIGWLLYWGLNHSKKIRIKNDLMLSLNKRWCRRRL
jgi:hypothetical protein